MSTVLLHPETYDRWRNSPLGALTERIETELVFRLAGQVNGVRILDAGCGDGTYAVNAGKLGAIATGMDASPATLRAARQRADRAGVHLALVAGDVRALPFPDHSFDLVLAVTVLCFVPDAALAFRDFARVLRSGVPWSSENWDATASGPCSARSVAG